MVSFKTYDHISGTEIKDSLGQRFTYFYINQQFTLPMTRSVMVLKGQNCGS